MTRKRIPANELLLQDMIAGEVSIPTVNDNKSSTVQPITLSSNVAIDETLTTGVKNELKESKTSKRKKENSYEELYLTYKPVNRTNRQQTYIDGELYEKFARFLKGVCDRKMSLSSFINNILQQHWEENKETIKQLYDNSMNKFLE